MNTALSLLITWRRYGPHGLIFRLADHPGDSVFERLQSISHSLEVSPPVGLVDYFRGFTTITLEFEAAHAGSLEALADNLARAWNVTPPYEGTPRRVEIPVVYDGPDLQRVADHTGMSTEEVCFRHQSAHYRVHMLGFCPGFPYLHGLDPRLHTPRLDTPRPGVAAGAVAIGGEHTGIYPVNRPGGWNIIGHTNEKLFHPDRAGGSDPERAFLLRPGDLIRFVPTS